ncbi:MAG TPA: F0F1 ATP synthase subunit epsilon [Aequorivita sp.]|nr:F0F1 ATP synthase subunit epsilon [Aequorivita sp.]
MDTNLMRLKILLPYGIFADIKNVKKVIAETTAGSYGILPKRLDCTAALVTGILVYETQGDEEKYIAVNEGILIKTGLLVTVSVRNAIGNAPLGELKAMVQREMVELDELEVNARSVMAKLETGFLRNFQNLRR